MNYTNKKNRQEPQQQVDFDQQEPGPASKSLWLLIENCRGQDKTSPDIKFSVTSKTYLKAVKKKTKWVKDRRECKKHPVDRTVNAKDSPGCPETCADFKTERDFYRGRQKKRTHKGCWLWYQGRSLFHKEYEEAKKKNIKTSRDALSDSTVLMQLDESGQKKATFWITKRVKQIMLENDTATSESIDDYMEALNEAVLDAEDLVLFSTTFSKKPEEPEKPDETENDDEIDEIGERKYEFQEPESIQTTITEQSDEIVNDITQGIKPSLLDDNEKRPFIYQDAKKTANNRIAQIEQLLERTRKMPSGLLGLIDDKQEFTEHTERIKTALKPSAEQLKYYTARAFRNMWEGRGEEGAWRKKALDWNENGWLEEHAKCYTTTARKEKGSRKIKYIYFSWDYPATDSMSKRQLMSSANHYEELAFCLSNTTKYLQHHEPLTTNQEISVRKECLLLKNVSQFTKERNYNGVITYAMCVYKLASPTELIQLLVYRQARQNIPVGLLASVAVLEEIRSPAIRKIMGGARSAKIKLNAMLRRKITRQEIEYYESMVVKLQKLSGLIDEIESFIRGKSC